MTFGCASHGRADGKCSRGLARTPRHHRANSSNCIPFGCRPSRIVSWTSGASNVSRSKRLTKLRVMPSASAISPRRPAPPLLQHPLPAMRPRQCADQLLIRPLVSSAPRRRRPRTRNSLDVPAQPKPVEPSGPTGVHHERHDRPFAKRLAGLQAMKALDQHEARLIPTYQNRHSQAVLQYIIREFRDLFHVQARSPLHRDVNVRNLDSDFAQDRPPAFCSSCPCHSLGITCVNSSNCIPFGCRPSRIAS